MWRDPVARRAQENGINFDEEIISNIFLYIRLVRTNGIPKEIYDEKADLKEQ